MAVSDWSTTAASNTTVGPVNIAEGCPAANMNNMGREIMAQVKQFTDGLPAAYQGKDQTLAALAALNTAANQLIYATGSDTFSLAALTPFARTLLDDGDAATARNTLGAVAVSQANLGGQGSIQFAFPGNTFRIAWGSVVANANGHTGINYVTPFNNFSVAVASGCGEQSPNAQDNNPSVVNCGPAGFTVYNSSNATTVFYIAVGV